MVCYLVCLHVFRPYPVIFIVPRLKQSQDDHQPVVCSHPPNIPGCLWTCHLGHMATFAGRVPTWSRALYLLSLIGNAIAAYITTFRYTYLANANTRFHGWPVPTVIFQRDGPDEPWLDFVGPTVVLAYPMNLVLFSIIPAILVLVSFYFHNRAHIKSAKPTLVTTNGTRPSDRIAADSENPYEPPFNAG